MATSKSVSQLTNKAIPALTDKLYLSDASSSTPTDKYITVQQLLNSIGMGMSGTYTPTYTIDSNVSGVVTYPTIYYRIGNIVTVSGQIRIDPINVSGFALRISVPIATTFMGNNDDGGGGGFSYTSRAMRIITQQGTNDVRMDAIPTNNSEDVWSFIFSYLISPGLTQYSL